MMNMAICAGRPQFDRVMDIEEHGGMNVHHKKAGNPYKPNFWRGPSGSRYAG